MLREPVKARPGKKLPPGVADQHLDAGVQAPVEKAADIAKDLPSWLKDQAINAGGKEAGVQTKRGCRPEVGSRGRGGFESRSLISHFPRIALGGNGLRDESRPRGQSHLSRISPVGGGRTRQTVAETDER